MTKIYELLEFKSKIPNQRGRAIKLKQTQTRDILFMSLLNQMIFIQIQLVYKLHIDFHFNDDGPNSLYTDISRT